MPNAKHREPIVPRKVKAAIQFMFAQTTYDLAAAAAHAGLTTYVLRREMKKPHVSKYVWHEKRALIEEVCTGNAAALAELRAKSENGMAVVAAIKQLELMRQSAIEEARGPMAPGLPRPGLVVIIQSADGGQQMIPPPQPAPQLVELDPIDEMRRPYQHEP
jgi:hypothetical protein